MRLHAPLLAGLLPLLTGCGARSSLPGALDARSKAPLWYRDGGERIGWMLHGIEDPEKERALKDLENRTHGTKWNEPFPEAVYGELRVLLLDPNEAVAGRAAFQAKSYRHAAVLPQLEQAHLRWPKNRQIERMFAKTAANCWSDEKLRTYFWNLPEDAPRNGELHSALRREMARCGTEEDAQRLEALLPQGADWRHDPVIARIRLHRSRRPDRLAYEILQFLDEKPAEGPDIWPAHLYRCELLRYLTFGDDPRYRTYIEGHLQQWPVFCTDQETYPHELNAILKAWLDKPPQ